MAAFELSSLFSDHAVLCRGKEIRIFGSAADGTAVKVTLLSASGSLMASDTVEARNGRFIALLPPQEAAVHCTLRVTDGHTETLACDIAIGDVFLAGGQSNMELELRNADGGPADIRSHENILVRYYNVPRCAVEGPDTDEENRKAHWQEIHPGEGRDMSAVAYYFAMKLQQEINVPIGIVDCYWGGSSISCWMTEETMQSIAEGQRYLRDYSQRVGEKTMEEYLLEEKIFQHGTQTWDRKAEKLKKSNPGITAQELNALLGPYPWFPPDGPGSPYRPCGLSMTMLSRVEPLSLTGVLFYQGEADADRTEHYDILLAAFITQLRRQFKDPLLPFLNIQLPMWNELGKSDSGNWPKLRQAQDTVAKHTRNSDLVILIDQGEYDNIHPTNKKVVGERLCYTALKTIYHMDAPVSPVPACKYLKDGCLYVVTDQPVIETGDAEPLFEIAGDDGVFYEANTELQQGTVFKLSHLQVARPTKVRYAWRDYAKVRYFGENGLPLAPFILE